jgi:hypothetical protein
VTNIKAFQAFGQFSATQLFLQTEEPGIKPLFVGHLLNNEFSALVQAICSHFKRSPLTLWEIATACFAWAANTSINKSASSG